MSLTGPDPQTPTRVGVPIADLLAGLKGALGVVSALYARQRTGIGNVVRTSLLASIVGAQAFQGTRYPVAGEVGIALGNHHSAIVPYGLFRCADGDIQVAVANDSSWRRFCSALALDPDHPDFADNASRVANREGLVVHIQRKLESASIDHWVTELQRVGVPVGAVRTLAQVYEDPQTVAQGLIIEVDPGSLGRLKLPGSALRFSRDQRFNHTAPLTLGQHNESIVQWLDELASRE